MKIPTGKNSYCGPFAIAALTGGTTDDASRLVRSLTGRRAIMWMTTYEMEQALTARGKSTTSRRWIGKDKPTLNQWINQHAKPDTSYVLLVTGHYVVIRNNRFSCSQTGKWVKLDDAPGKRRRVIRAWELKED